MKSLFLKTIYVALVISIFIPTVIQASELRFDASKVEVRDGEEFVITAVLYAERVVNAIEGRVSFPDDLLAVREIRDGNSSINFWIEKPHIESPGVIVYSGITPGGFSGVNNLLFSIVFETKQTGIAHIVTKEAKVLQNDGAGTELAVIFRNIGVEIKEGSGNKISETTEDTEVPEAFTPVVVQDSSMFDGKYFLVFATQDKNSGVKRYEVREGRFGWWKEAESPYVLSRQRLDRDIYMRVIDNAGNDRVTVVRASVHTAWWEQYGLFAILIVLILAVMMYKKAWVHFIK